MFEANQVLKKTLNTWHHADAAGYDAVVECLVRPRGSQYIPAYPQRF